MTTETIIRRMWFASIVLMGLAWTAVVPAADWQVIDGGWCSLVEVPLPEASAQPVAEATAAETQAVPAGAEEDGEAGFRLLFNGENLDGWTIQGLEKAGPKVKDGVLAMDGWDYWAVISQERFKNFILRFEVKYDARGNTGVLLHTDPEKVFQTAPEIQFAADEASEVNRNTSGTLLDKSGVEVPAQWQADLPVGEWNSVEIKYVEPNLWVTINGQTVQEGVDLSGMATLDHKNSEGHLALQRNDFKKAAYLRNIRIKELSD